MEIGTIGAGDWAQAFAKRVLKAGHKIKLSNSRGPDSLREIVNQLGPGATAATKEEAAACEIVLLAVPWDNVPETLAGLPKWKKSDSDRWDQSLSRIVSSRGKGTAITVTGPGLETAL